MAAWSWYGPGLLAAQASVHDRLAFVDHRSVPSTAVLSAQENERAVRGESGISSGLGQEQQRQQAGNLNLVRHEGGEQPAKSDGLAPQIGAVALRRWTGCPLRRF